MEASEPKDWTLMRSNGGFGVTGIKIAGLLRDAYELYVFLLFVFHHNRIATPRTVSVIH